MVRLSPETPLGKFLILLRVTLCRLGLAEGLVTKVRPLLSLPTVDAHVSIPVLSCPNVVRLWMIPPRCPGLVKAVVLLSNSLRLLR